MLFPCNNIFLTLVFLTAFKGLYSSYDAALPVSMHRRDTNAIEHDDAARSLDANIGLPITGCGVGIEAFASPI